MQNTCQNAKFMLYYYRYAAVVELADAPDSKSGGSDTVSVRLRPTTPKKNASYLLRSFSFVRFPQILFDFICLFHHPRGGILASLVAFALFVRSAKWLRTRTQNPVVVIPCRFDSDRRHQKNLIVFDLAFV